MQGYAVAQARLAEPTAHVSAARLVLAGLEGLGVDGPVLAPRAGLPAPMVGESSDRVPTECLIKLWRVGLARADDPGFGLQVASQWRFGRLQLADYLFGTAATLVEAIGGLEQYSAVLNTAANEIRLTESEHGGGTITYQVRSGDPDVDAVASQAALAVVLFRARHAVGREIRPLHLGLVSAAPPRYRELAGRFGAHRIDFGTESATMTLAPADLPLPLLDADAPLAAVLQEYAATMIATQAATAAWADQLRQVITAQLAGDGLSLPAAARQLTVSPRSLQRRLADEGTSWRELADEVRRDRAAVLLAHGLSRTAVAARLGFSDVRALRGARRRWDAGPGS